MSDVAPATVGVRGFFMSGGTHTSLSN